MDHFENVLTQITKRFDIDMKRSEAYVEMAMMEAAINLEEGEYKVFCENGTDEDLEYILEEANEGFISKVKTAIEKMIEAIKKFFRDLKDKIISFFTKKETDEALDKLQKKAKLNPFVKNKKVKVEDTDSEIKLIDKYMAKLKGFIAKIKSGNRVDEEEIDDARDEFTKKRAIIAGTVTTITVAAALVLGSKYIKDLRKNASTAETEAVDNAEAGKEAVDKTADAESAGRLQKLVSEISRISQEKGTLILRAPIDLINKVKSAFVKSDATVNDDQSDNVHDSDDDETKEESSDDDFESNLTAEFAALLGD